MIAYELREDVVPLLNKEELQDNIKKTTLQMKTLKDYESKLGDVIYSFTLYKKIKRANIPLHHPELEVLAISFDRAADHDSIIMDKILPALRQRNLTAAVEA
jgi:hypothetical protein